MASKKSPFTVAIGADRPKLTAEQVLQAAQEANLLAAELLQEAQILLKMRSLASTDPNDGRGQLSKPTTMRLRGLVEVMAGDE